MENTYTPLKEYLGTQGKDFSMANLQSLATEKGVPKVYKRTPEQRERYRLSKLGDKNPMKGKHAWHFGKKTGIIPKSAFKKGYIPWNKGLKATEDERLVYNRPTTIKKGENKLAILGCLKQQNSKVPTSIEKKLYEELEVRKIVFEKQKLINNRFIVDAFIPSLNLVIEADGDYWHSLDRIVKKDKAQNAYLTKCGFKILRLSESEINNGSFRHKLNI